MKETVTLGMREQHRLLVISEIERGEMRLEEGAAVLDLSVRQVRRLVAGYRVTGAASLVHGNHGRVPVNRVPAEIRQAVVALASDRYAGVNSQHLTELLLEHEGLALSPATVKRILAKAGVDRPKTRRQPRHRRRRPRAPKAGMLLQIDGSHHAWLEERGPRLVLIAGIDDATGTVPAALFREREDAAGYLALLQQVCLTVGIPLAVYHDGHGIFGVVNLKGSRAYREGRIRYEPTQVERVLAELAIGSIAAQSPQAKGRIERLFGTFQDRLVTELRLAGAATIEEANTVLDTYLPRFNAQFAVPADDPVSAYRPWPEDLAPERIFCFKYQRQVGADNVVRFEQHRLQLRPTRERRHFARCQVEVAEQLDGALVVRYREQVLATHPAPDEAPRLRARSGPRPTIQQTRREECVAVPSASSDTQERHTLRTSRKPPPDHPWRQRYTTPK
ncbi:MAG TPA: ISNCY family transposase [Chloroflexota bacterium]|nr:ISNCY family transposase [Chloroflexota bacterium]